MTEKEKQHLGTKFLALFMGITLSVIYAILQFFTHPTLTVDILYNIALVEAFFVLVWVLIIILAELVWRYAHKYSEKFSIELYIPLKFWKLKTLSLNYVP